MQEKASCINLIFNMGEAWQEHSQADYCKYLKCCLHQRKAATADPDSTLISFSPAHVS